MSILRIQKKQGKTYETVNTIHGDTDESEAYILRELSSLVINKYIWKYPSIKRIEGRNNYDGTYTYTITFDNGGRYKFITERL